MKMFVSLSQKILIWILILNTNDLKLVDQILHSRYMTISISMY